MIDRICFLVGYNLYESKRHFAEKLAEALERLDVETSLIDIDETEGFQQHHLDKILTFRPSLTCSFHSMIPVEGGYYLCDFLKLPHLSLLVDPSIYSLDIAKSPYAIASCVDRNDVEMFKRKGFDRSFLLPHAVEREFAESPAVEKKYPIVFIGSCYDPEGHRSLWKERYSNDIVKVLEHAAEQALNNSEKTFVETLVEAWDQSGLNPADKDFTEYCHLVDGYVRAKDRLDLIKAVKTSEVHIFGDVGWQANGIDSRGWAQLTGELDHIYWHPPVCYEEALQILRQSQVCLNSMPFFRDGTHERVFNGLAARSLVITGQSRYLQERLSEDEGVLYYTYGDWEALNTQLELLLSDLKKVDRVTELGRAQVLANHTWDKRAEILLSEVEPIIEKMAEENYIRSF